jgi:hypothetical protein
MQVLGDDAGRILHRHLIARERHQAGLKPLVQAMERSALERWIFSLIGQLQAPSATRTFCSGDFAGPAPSVVGT